MLRRGFLGTLMAAAVSLLGGGEMYRETVESSTVKYYSVGKYIDGVLVVSPRFDSRETALNVLERLNRIDPGYRIVVDVISKTRILV